MAIDFGKRFGLGTLRLPLKDPSDQKSIDYDQFCEMVDKFLDHGFSYFDFYLIHSITSQGYKECNEWSAFEFLAEARAAGKFREFGVSLHDTPEFLDQILTEHPEIDFVVVREFEEWTPADEGIGSDAAGFTSVADE